MSRFPWISGAVAAAMALAPLGFVSTPAARPEPVPAPGEQDGKLRILVFGAHPDDAEIRAGGVAAMWAALGHHVKLVSVTNGDIGHWQQAGGALAQRRAAEVRKAAEILGIEETEVLDIHDGELMPTLENRRKIVRLIRRFQADVVISHRPNDYHPDHRYTGVLVQDAAYMVIVPFFCPDTPYLTRNPVFLYCADRFQRPSPFRPDIVVDIDSVIDKKVDALAAIESQFLEGGCTPRVRRIPESETERRQGLERVRSMFHARAAGTANRYRDQLVTTYGEERGRAVKHAEAFEICEYGARPSPAMLRTLFPFPGRAR